MSKSRKVSKSTLAILALSLILAVSLVFGATFAWFKGSDDTANSTVTIGTFSFKLDGTKNSSEDVILFEDVAAAVPGQKIALNEVKADFTGSNVRAVLRVKVVIDGTGITEGGPLAAAAKLTDLQGNNWGKDGDYYYYLGIIDNTETAQKINILTASSTIEIDSTLEAVESVMGKTLSIKLVAEAAQADYTNGSALTSVTNAAEVKAVFEAVNA